MWRMFGALLSLLPISTYGALRFPAGPALAPLTELRHREATDGVGGDRTCVPLRNHDSHFTVEIGIGQPPQKMDLVIDTGSSDLVVESCVCRDLEYCKSTNKCFWGKKSGTFAFKLHDGKVDLVDLHYGSGKIRTAVMTDDVSVGDAKARMVESLLLMMDHALDFDGPFEGIVGLGMRGTSVSKAGFLESAGVSSFSLCFGLDGTDGVLRLGAQLQEEKLGSVGTIHWGLGLEGISVGDDVLPLEFCNRDQKMRSGQETPCGAIPDSGTTIFAAPRAHIEVLFKKICMNWPKCKGMWEKEKYTPPFAIMGQLMASCTDWMHDADGLAAMPTLHFDLSGASDRKLATGEKPNTVKVSIPPSSYVLIQHTNLTKEVDKYLDSFPIKMNETTDEQQDNCFAAFDILEYPTTKNGDIWIFGLPLFYDYRVSYDTSTTPPSMSLAEQPCGGCQDGREVGIEDKRKHMRTVRAPRRVRGIRRTSVDVTQPL